MGTRLRAQDWSVEAAPERGLLREGDPGPGCPTPTFSPGPPLLPGWPGKPCGNKAGIKPCAQHQRPCPAPRARRQHPRWVLAPHPGTAQGGGCHPTGDGAPTLPYSRLVPGVPVALAGRPVPRRPARDREDVTAWQRNVQRGGVHRWDKGLLAKEGHSL